MQKKYINISILFFAAFIISLSFVLFFQFNFTGDEKDYYVLGYNLAKHAIFSVSTGQELVKTTLREPLYPTYIAAVLLLSNYSVLAVKIIQIFFILGTAYFASQAAVRLYGEKFRIYILAGVLFFPTLLNFPQYLYSESLAVFLFMLFVYCEISLLLYSRFSTAIITGFVYAALVLCKVVMLYFAVALAILILLYYRNKQAIIAHILMFSVCFIMIFPWAARNHGVIRSYKLTFGRELSCIATRNLKQDLPPNEIFKEFVFNFSETLGKKIFPNAMNRVESYSFTLRLNSVYEAHVNALRDSGMTMEQINNNAEREYLNKMFLHPFKFIIITLSELTKMVNFSYLPLLKDPQTISFLETAPKRDIFLGTMRLIFKAYGYMIIFFFAYFIISDFKNIKKHSLCLFLILYVNLFYSLFYAEARYAVLLIPLYVIFACNGLMAFYNRRLSGKDKNEISNSKRAASIS